MRLLKSPLQIKSFLIFQSPNLFLKAVLYHLMFFIFSKVLVSSYWCAADELAAFEMLTSKVLNAKLYTSELGYRDFTWKNQTPFQAFPGSLSRAVDIQGSSDAHLSNPRGRSANLLIFCHSHMQHSEPTPVLSLRRVQKDKIDFNAMNLFLRSLSWFCAHFSAEDSLFLFGSLSFPSVQQLGKIQHVLAKSGNSFI